MPLTLRSVSRAALMVAAPVALTAALAALVVAPPSRAARADDDLGVEGAFHAKAGGGPVYEVMSGDSFFFDKVPENIRTREKCEKTSLASNEVAKIEGQFKLDFDAPDFTGLSSPKPPEVTCTFKRKGGGDWQFFPMKDALVKRGNISSSNSKQAFAFGITNLGTPLEPKQRLVFRLKGKCRLEKDRKNISLDAPFELVVGSKTRDRDTGKYAGAYDTLQEGYEVKVLIPETFEIPGHGKGMSIVYTSATCSE